MWVPCNFGETIKLRRHMNYPLEEYEFVGLQIGIPYQDGMPFTYEFRHVENGTHESFAFKDTLAYWPKALNNEDSYDRGTLHEGEIELTITPGETYYKYNRYFLDTTSHAQGRCISIIHREDGWRYAFYGHDGLAKYFTVQELLVDKQFEAYEDDPLLQ